MCYVYMEGGEGDKKEGGQKEKMDKRTAIVATAMLMAAILVAPVAVYAQQIPHGISGIVYMSDGVTEAPWDTSFSVNDTTSGFFIEGTTGVEPHSGWYSVSINGTDGDLILIRAWNETHYGERAVSLAGDMTGIDVTIDKTLGPEPPVTVFDTGAPRNPYPAIAGTHNGTLKPNVTINVTSLFTYPCAGTGGHTEYAKIWNSTSNATAKSVEGYKMDWHNLSFSKPFILVANETYNYTIITGSYPQIHHTKALQTANGWINSTEFIDVNGKIKYWIPAIRLFVYYNK